MTAVRKPTLKAKENPNDPNVRDPEHKHELGGTLGMTVGGIAGGIAAGAAVGALIGTAAGPIGIVAGAAIGGALGGSAGESIAREVNPTAEEKYWSENYHTRTYVTDKSNFETYRPAYRTGIDAYKQNPNVEYSELEPSIRNNWGHVKGESSLEWNDAREASRDAFDRLKTTSKNS